MNKQRRIRIVGSGPARAGDWSITDADTGQLIEKVRRVEIVADAEGDTYAVLFVHYPDVDVTIDATLTDDQRDLAVRIADEVERRLHDRLEHYIELLVRRRELQ